MKKSIISFITIIFLISLLGLSNFNNSLLIKQSIWITIGLISYIIFQKFNINILIKYSFVLYILNVLLLGLVLIIGKEINGSKAWLSFGFFSFQPSEFMKIALSLTYYKIIKGKNDLLSILKLFILFIIPTILVFLEPDTGAIIIYLIIFLVALFNLNTNKKIKIGFILFGFLLLLSFILIYIYNPNTIIKLLGTSIYYRLDRIIHFKNNYQLNQALIYLGSAKLFGHKTILHIPEAHTDFIFAFLIGRYGLIIGLMILISYFIIDISLINNLKKNLLIQVFFFTFLYTQIQNIFMNIGLLPIMGIPLTFLSYGGTNIIASMIFLGIISNKKRYT